MLNYDKIDYLSIQYKLPTGETTYLSRTPNRMWRAILYYPDLSP